MKKISTEKQFGFSLIGILIIIGALVLTAAGVVVWREKISQPVPKPILTITPTASPTPISQAPVKPPSLPVNLGKTWVKIYPKQCMSNPWEVDWFKTRGIDMNNCPVPCGQLIDGPEAIKEYYAKQGVATIHEIRSISFEEEFGKSGEYRVNWPGGAFCEACSCLRGDTLYLLVSDSDVSKMIDLGYKVVEQ